jgi:hypothetical protein
MTVTIIILMMLVLGTVFIHYEGLRLMSQGLKVSDAVQPS